MAPIIALLILAAFIARHVSRVPKALDELFEPSNGESAHYRAVTFGGHVLLGAALVAAVGLVFGPLGAWQDATALAVAAAYWLAKELPDIFNGGDPWDGVEDTAAVGIGALYAGPAWWPFVALAFAVLLLLRGGR